MSGGECSERMRELVEAYVDADTEHRWLTRAAARKPRVVYGKVLQQAAEKAESKRDALLRAIGEIERERDSLRLQVDELTWAGEK